MGVVTSSMAAKFAFFPPKPPSYELVEDGDGKMKMSSGGMTERSNVDVLKIKTKRGTEIVGIYFKNPAANMTVLYSHGNAADLGQMYDLFAQLIGTLVGDIALWEVDSGKMALRPPLPWDTESLSPELLFEPDTWCIVSRHLTIAATHLSCCSVFIFVPCFVQHLGFYRL
ncbi:hypothetical protein DCAR_0830361 [Daucus carota subsp. sativus]|uniref:Uncharacterized protein n=1 Tax=Daucus carota subsp. sativus TaxID=79200 RepID=A0A175YKI0_DAUCS|nr:hypothetical protein DCAR_0830361 [Daucus carota subsp. sativus]